MPAAAVSYVESALSTGDLELLYVVVYKTDKGGIAGTNNSHLFFAHKLFEFSHDYFNILICGEAHHQSGTIHFNKILQRLTLLAHDLARGPSCL